MSWEAYKWVWRVCSPLHLGTAPAGMLNRTRLYIPASTIWGALTAELARRRQSLNYEDVGKELDQHARFSYLFPARQVGGEWKVWLPLYGEKGLVWRRQDESEQHGREPRDRRMRSLLLDTRPGTAIDPTSHSAQEGTLRELECIQPFWREGEGSRPSPVAFVGYMFVERKELGEEINRVKELFVGGDISYGLGKLIRISWEPARECFGRPLNLDGPDPLITSDVLLGHCLESSNKNRHYSGAMEAFQRWNITGPCFLALAWSPGSICLADEERRQRASLTFKISPKGIWEEHQDS